jgi:ABC-type phosphate/phosphonate transport system substrate-binding protein
MACASLAMYDAPAPVEAANDRLWSEIRQRLRAGGFSAPESLDRQIQYDQIWLKPDLILAQTCGYPYVKQLSGKVRLVGTPVHRFPGGVGALRSSFVVVGDDSNFTTVADLRGSHVAINDGMSNSGMNLLRALIAPLAVDGRFFSDVTTTGGHLASMAAVKAGTADVAAIDSVTYGLMAKHAPESLNGLRILAETPSGPSLPLITRMDASDEEVTLLRQAVSDVATDPQFAAIAEPLGLVGIEWLDDTAYRKLKALEAEAIARNYPVIA